ncbi:MAG TPA: hypothetical protein ENI87_01465 [bacterium]|nr:hypothetical protein [bacterium]
MRLPLPFLLYATALGLFGWAGWTVYDALPLWKLETRERASTEGRDKAHELIAIGKGQGPQSSDWNYARKSWWEQLTQVNLIGKLPEKKPTPEEIEAAKKEAEPKVDMTPLEDIFELVTLVYDSETDGRGGESHVVIRYKETANVEPPEWWRRENTPVSAAPMAGAARDLIATQGQPGARNGRPNRGSGRNARGVRNGRPQPARPSAMPAGSVTTGREILQKLWLDGGDDERRSASLWDNYSHIRLVRVAPDAQSAFFVRELPPTKEGEPAPEPKEEELLKTTTDISQDILQALRKLQGREGVRDGSRANVARATPTKWREVEETTRFGNQFHIGRKDERRFQDPEEFFNKVYVDTYVSRSSDLRGVQVRSVEPQLAQRFGVQPGEVLLEINNRKVSSKGQAMNMVKKDYNRGVRTFATKWLSNGQVVERVYQAPDK